MKLGVIGLGSMGKRRIRLLKGINPEIELIGVDTNNERRIAVSKEFQIQTVDEVQKRDQFDGFVISTSPLSHGKIIESLLQHKVPIFTELNLVDDNYDLFIQNEDVLFLSSTLLYRKDIEYITKEVNHQKVNYCYHIGQYLPDWHPWENYKDFFIGDKRTNGCREILAIDLPWMIECFGEVDKITVVKDKMTDLEIDYPDNFMIVMEHSNGSKGTLLVDVVARKAVRKLEVYSQSIYLTWEGTPQSLNQYDFENKKDNKISVYSKTEHHSDYSENIIEDAYQAELMAFLKLVEDHNRSDIKYSFAKDKKILELIDLIER